METLIRCRILQCLGLHSFPIIHLGVSRLKCVNDFLSLWGTKFAFIIEHTGLNSVDPDRIQQNLASGSTIITLNIGTDRPEQTMQIQIRCHKMQCLIRVYTGCHLSSTITDTPTSSKIDFFKFLDMYGKELRRPNT